MGLYDNVNFECKCPGCGNTVVGFQTKDLACQLETVETANLLHWYAWCQECGLWIDVENKPVKTEVVITPREFFAPNELNPYPKQGEAKRRLKGAKG